MVELFRLVGRVLIENNDANDAIDETADKADSMQSKISKTFGKVGSKMTSFGTKLLPVSAAIGGVGLASVNAAAEVKAANSQFEQTFGELQSQASSAMEKVAEESGILQTRLQGIGTSIFAFAKSSGGDSAESMALMETALQATADAAAYYDRSLEDTAESLKSFLKGNFENDAALGLSCTETTRNAAAMELFGAKYNDLSEIQKQQTLLKMVTDAQELSGAMGQAARESDGLENVTGNLKESIKQLGASFGESLLPIVTGAIQKATAFIEKINDMDEGTKKSIVRIAAIAAVAAPALIAVGSLTSGVGSMITMFAKLPGTVSKGVVAMKNIRSGFVLAKSGMTGLATQTSAFGATLAGISAPVVAAVAAVVAIIGVLVGAFMHLWNTNEEFRNNITAIWDGIKAKFENFTNGLLERINSLGFNFQSITDVIKAIWQGFCDFLAPVFETTFQLISDTLGSALDLILNIVDFFAAVFKGDWQGAGEAVMNIVKTLLDYVKNIFNTMHTFIMRIVEQIKRPVLDTFEKIKSSVTGKLNTVKSTVTSIFENIRKTISDKINSAKAVVENGINKIKGFFNFSWSLPKLKLPHFKISGSFSLNPPSVPSFGIDWYAKAMDNPMIMNKPTAFGINSMGQIMAGGEAGSEVVSGTDTLMGMIRRAVSEASNAQAIADAVKESLSDIEFSASLKVEPDDRRLLKIVEKQAKIVKKATGREVFA
jgi:phage-related protein